MHACAAPIAVAAAIESGLFLETRCAWQCTEVSCQVAEKTTAFAAALRIRRRDLQTDAHIERCETA